MRALPAALLVLASAALSAQAVPQEPPRRLTTGDRAGATAVVVDVVVRDARGRPVVTLGADDFEVYEDGVRQPIGSFRPPIAAGAAPRAAPSAAAAAAAPPVAAAPATKPAPNEPTVVSVVFDRLSVDSRKLAVDAMRRYLGDAPQSANIVGVFDIESALSVLQPFTQDTAALRASLARVSAVRPVSGDVMHVTDMRGPGAQGLAGGPSIGPRGRPADDLTVSVGDLFDELQATFDGITAMRGIAAIVGAVSRVPGRKSILVFSEGVELTRDNDPRFYSLIDQANRANVAIYTVDAAGLRLGSYTLLAGRYAADAANDGANLQSARNFEGVVRLAPNVGLGILANETGGQLIDGSNDLFKAFPRLDEDLRSYYALTYVPPRAEPDGKFHKIEVKVKRPGLSAKARSGYTSLPIAAGSMPVLAYEARALARLESKPVPNDLPILARGFVFPVSHETADVPLLVSIPSGILDYGRDEAAGTFEADAVALVRVRDTDGRVVHKASEQYTLSGRLENIEASRRGELLFYRQARLPSGVYTLESIVLDSRSGKASVRVSSLEVPSASQAALRVGTPFIVRRAEAVPEAERDTANPLYFGDVLLYPNLGQPLSKATDRELAFGFSAYDGHGGPVEATLQLLKSGQVVATVPLALGSPDAQGRINQISKLPLEALAPGAYELRVTVTAGTQQVTRAVPFALAGS